MSTAKRRLWTSCIVLSIAFGAYVGTPQFIPGPFRHSVSSTEANCRDNLRDEPEVDIRDSTDISGSLISAQLIELDSPEMGAHGKDIRIILGHINTHPSSECLLEVMILQRDAPIP